MFKKWRITGRNNRAIKGIAAILSLILLMALLPVLPAVAEEKTVSPGALLDLDPNAWYYAETAEAVRAGLFKGDDQSRLNPEGTVTRAQFTVLAYRLFGGEKDPVASLPQEITDVSATDWYAKEVAWAYSCGVVNGITPTEFAPNMAISRQEMCVLMGRAIEKKTNQPLTADGAPVYSDEESIASWALDYVKKCSNIHLFAGSGGAFLPLDVATRAQAACVLYRYYAKTHSLLEVSGFAINFQEDTDYYLCRAQDFANCKILGYKGEGTLTVGVEQYGSYYPYRNSPYRLGDSLNLGHGRAKITLQITKNGVTKEYMIAMADPNGADYSYAKARVSNSGNVVNVRKSPSMEAEVIQTLIHNATVYYLKTEGDWCMIQLINQVNKGQVGYVHKDYLRWGWLETKMPQEYAEKISALQAAHPNWTFSFVDVELTKQEALDLYGANKASYIDPLTYLTEDNIFAFYDVTQTSGTDMQGIHNIWINENTFSKAEAATLVSDAAMSLNMNPYYIACRIAQEATYGGSSFAKGMSSVSNVTIRENVTINGVQLTAGTHYDYLDLGATYYNFYGIAAYDNNPRYCMVYAANRNWNSVERGITEGANWIKDQYLDRGSVTPYFFRYGSFKRIFSAAHSYMSDAQAPLKEAVILKRAFADPNAKAHFIVPVYH